MTFLLTHWRLAASVLALIAAFGSGWYVRAKIADADMAKVERRLQEAVDKQRARADAAAASYEATRAALDQQSYATNTVIREYYDANPASPDCAVPAPVASSLRDAVEGANAAATGKSAATVSSDPAAP